MFLCFQQLWAPERFLWHQGSAQVCSNNLRNWTASGNKQKEWGADCKCPIQYEYHAQWSQGPPPPAVETALKVSRKMHLFASKSSDFPPLPVFLGVVRWYFQRGKRPLPHRLPPLPSQKLLAPEPLPPGSPQLPPGLILSWVLWTQRVQVGLIQAPAATWGMDVDPPPK